MTDVALAGLSIADPPERWAALGFHVRDGQIKANSVMLTLGIAPPGGGIVGWTLAGAGGEGDVSGLPTRWVEPGSGMDRLAPAAGGGIGSLDHVVVATPAFDAFATELGERGVGLRRVAEVRGTRMGFRRLGGPILEVVEAPEAPATAFWGVTFAMRGPPGGVESLDALCARNRFVGEPRPAVQPGRRIATVAREAGLSTRVAFIDPVPR
ncbi:MAG TPA: hypothetical protein VGL69_01680 [Solirubrobacteraceae bacterium]